MSLWRVKHTLSPIAEYALVLVAAGYGATAIYFASLAPLVTALTADVRSVPPPIGLDTDAWPRYENAAGGYQFAVPPVWAVDMADPDRVIAEYGAHGARRADPTRRISIEILPLGEREEAANVAASDFAGLRPALYDVAVYGAQGLFSIAFSDGRVAKQAVYLPIGHRLLVLRGGAVDPAVFAAFVSSVKFYPDLVRAAETN